MNTNRFLMSVAVVSLSVFGCGLALADTDGVVRDPAATTVPTTTAPAGEKPPVSNTGGNYSYAAPAADYKSLNALNYRLPSSLRTHGQDDDPCGSLCALSAAASTVGVANRQRPDYDAKGLPFGAFRVFPTLVISPTYTDNVYYTDVGAIDDLYVQFTPRVSVISQWSSNMLELHAGLDERKFSTYDSEDQTNWDVGGSGRLDILRGLNVSDVTNYKVVHEPRYSPDTVGLQANPTEVGVFHQALSLNYKPSIIGVQITGAYDDYKYSSVNLVGGGVLSNADRSHANFSGKAKVSVEVSPGYDFYVQGSYENRAYEVRLDRNNYDRNSTGWSADGGVDLFFTDLLEGTLYAGYQSERFKAPLESVSGIDYGAELHWYATKLITVNLGAEHSIENTVVAGASASNNQSVYFGLDYELRRNVILQGAVSYERNDYKGAASRSDDYYTFSLKAKYLLNRYFSADLHYTHEERASGSGSSGAFSNNIVMVGLTSQL